MRSARLLLSLAVLTLSAATAAGGEPSPTSAVLGQQIENFALPDTSGKLVSLTDFRDMKAVAVVFVGTECPVNNAYLQRLGEMAKEYSAKQVQFLAINSNSHDTSEDVAEHVREHQLTIPVLKDEGNRVADLFTAERTPEAFVLDEQRKVRYRGRIDNQYGVGFRRPQPTRQDLALALDEVLAGRSVSQPVTEVSSCRIARVIAPQSQASVTYTKHIAPLLQQHCQECHRPSQIGPMDLLTYEDAKAWSATIREAVVERRMPPLARRRSLWKVRQRSRHVGRGNQNAARLDRRGLRRRRPGQGPAAARLCRRLADRRTRRGAIHADGVHRSGRNARKRHSLPELRSPDRL
jgi:peroxiredoxin